MTASFVTAKALRITQESHVFAHLPTFLAVTMMLSRLVECLRIEKKRSFFFPQKPHKSICTECRRCESSIPFLAGKLRAIKRALGMRMYDRIILHSCLWLALASWHCSANASTRGRHPRASVPIHCTWPYAYRWHTPMHVWLVLGK